MNLYQDIKNWAISPIFSRDVDGLKILEIDRLRAFWLIFSSNMGFLYEHKKQHSLLLQNQKKILTKFSTKFKNLGKYLTRLGDVRFLERENKWKIVDAHSQLTY